MAADQGLLQGLVGFAASRLGFCRGRRGHGVDPLQWRRGSGRDVIQCHGGVVVKPRRVPAGPAAISTGSPPFYWRPRPSLYISILLSLAKRYNLLAKLIQNQSRVKGTEGYGEVWYQQKHHPVQRAWQAGTEKHKTGLHEL